MSSRISAGTKFCCHCGRDVAGAKRMKDSEGKYWCIQCGENDKKRRRLAEGGICSGCGESISPTKMTSIGGLPYCDKCLKRRYQAGATAARMGNAAALALSPARWFSTGENASRNKMLLVGGVVLVVASVLAKVYIF